MNSENIFVCQNMNIKISALMLVNAGIGCMLVFLGIAAELHNAAGILGYPAVGTIFFLNCAALKRFDILALVIVTQALNFIAAILIMAVCVVGLSGLAGSFGLVPPLLAIFFIFSLNIFAINSGRKKYNAATNGPCN